MKRGDKGEEVKHVQTLLGIKADGVYGAQTEDAVFEFQRKHMLTADGIVGVKTLAALEAEYKGQQTTDNGQQTDVPTITLRPISKHLTAKAGRTIKYIVIHYTAGASSAAGKAELVRNQFATSDRSASADFCVDDKYIIQCNGDIKNKYTWAVGDGNGKYGITNANSVSIEMCSTLRAGTSSAKPNHKGWSITDATVDNTVRLTRYLMAKYGIDKAHVVRHWDASRKCCPGVLGWNKSAVYTEQGVKTSALSDENKWLAFKGKL